MDHARDRRRAILNHWRHHLRRARLAGIWLAAIVVIAAGVAMGVVQLVLPIATQHPDFIAQQLSLRLHRSVRFTAISSQALPSGPLLSVRDLTLGPEHSGGGSVTFARAAIKFDFGAWLLPAHRWITLRLQGAELQVERTRRGWEVAGFGSSASRSHATLQSLPVDLDLADLRVDIVDRVTGRSWRLLAPHIAAVNTGHGIRFGGSVRQVGTRQAVAVRGRVDAAARNYDLYVASRDLDLADAVRGLDLRGYSIQRGRADFQLWSHWRSGHLASATLQYALRGLVASGPAGRYVDLPFWSGDFKAMRRAKGWDVAWRGPGKRASDIDQAGGVVAQLRGVDKHWQVSAAVRDVDLTPWLALAAMAPEAPQALVDWVVHAQPHVHVDSAALVWHGGQHYDATLHFSDLRAAPVGQDPGLALAHGTLRADGHALSLELAPQPATLALAHVFRQPFVFQRLQGTFVAWRQDGRWNFGVGNLHFDMGNLAGSGDARLVWRGRDGRPFVSAYIAFAHAKLANAAQFFPYRHMSPALVRWLDHALVGGEMDTGRILVRGDLGHWPFVDQAGRFEATGEIRGATLDFDKAWPRATGVDASLDFVDDHMAIVASRARVRDVAVDEAKASIPDLHHGVLDLSIRGSGSGTGLLDFVRHSPLGSGAREALQGLHMGGTGKFGIQLSIPLHDARAFTLGGMVDLARADVSAPKWNLELKNLAGPLQIEDRGFSARALSATFRGAPASLSLAVGGSVADPADSVEASLDTTASAQALAEGYPDLQGLVDHTSGTAPFHIAVKVIRGKPGVPEVPVLDLESSLVGIALHFPAPLHKAANAALPLQVRLRLPPAGAPLTVSLGKTLQVQGRLADPAHGLPTALAMNFGALPPAAPTAAGWVVGGRAPRLDLSGWIQQALASGTGSAFPQLVRADVATEHAEVFGADMGALKLQFQAGADSDTFHVDGAAAAGSIEVPTKDLMTRGITARLERLDWPASAPGDASAPIAQPSVVSPVAPTAIPPLEVTVGDLRVGAADFGAATLVSRPTSQGMQIERLDSRSKDLSITAHGDWNGTQAASSSHMVSSMTARNFGQTLAALGFGGFLAGGENAHVHIDGTWAGPPAALSLAWLQGTLDIQMDHGRILAVKPGFGRLLGLLSLRELPSRLMLHFGDVFKSGFGFDHASAHFRVDDGSAYTQDLSIKAPAAQIKMRGRTGFRAHDFDLVVDVTPHVGVTLPVVGAVIGGPVGAAAGLVVQGLVGRGINKAAGSMYRVTGSWDKPDVVGVASGDVPALMPAPSAGAPAAAASVPSPSGSIAPTAVLPAPAMTVAPAPAASASAPAASASAPAASASAPAAPAGGGE